MTLPTLPLWCWLVAAAYFLVFLYLLRSSRSDLAWPKPPLWQTALWCSVWLILFLIIAIVFVRATVLSYTKRPIRLF